MSISEDTQSPAHIWLKLKKLCFIFKAQSPLVSRPTRWSLWYWYFGCLCRSSIFPYISYTSYISKSKWQRNIVQRCAKSPQPMQKLIWDERHRHAAGPLLSEAWISQWAGSGSLTELRWVHSDGVGEYNYVVSTFTRWVQRLSCVQESMSITGIHQTNRLV